MKLLLTSAGIRNQNIAEALVGLVGKPAFETKIVLIPTAANVESGNKDWFIDQFTDPPRFGFSWIDVVDPSANGVDWKKRLNEADVVMVGGGNTFHLLDQIRKTGLGEWLDEAVKTKVYVGVSAGSIITTPTIAIASVGEADENLAGTTDLSGLSLVEFEVSPHTPEIVSVDDNIGYAKTIKRKLYAYDNETAIKVAEGEIEFVGTGQHWEFN